MPIWASLAAFFPDPQADGLPSPSATAQLDTLQTRLYALLQAGGTGRLVGVVTTKGRREFILYTATPELVRGAARILQGEFAGLELQLTVMADPEWVVFRQFVAEDQQTW